MLKSLLLLTAAAPSSVDITPLLQDVEVTDDPLEKSVLFSTYGMVDEKIDPNPMADHTVVYLVASKNRASGELSYGISIRVLYSDRSWRFYHRVNYTGAKEVVEFQVVAANRRVSQCYTTMNICTYVESFLVPMEVSDFNALASKHNNVEPWFFKFVGKSGVETRHFFMPAEAAALRKVVENHSLAK